VQPSEPIVEVKNVSKYFGKKKVLENVSFTVFKREILLIIGLSGTGKSTLLKLICNLEEPDSGEVILKTNNIGMVFQGAALFDSLNVFDNVAFPIVNSKIKLQDYEIEKRVLEKLKLVGLAGMEYYRVDELSGGMKKRVSFARAIIDNPEIILYDEPTSGLDPVVSHVIVDYILKLQNELNASGVLVTHNLNIVKKIASRVILLYDAKIVWEGISKDLFVSENPYVKQFVEGAIKGPMVVIKE
jgi:phospholipid/cholesterol/gamma-HCH transport system ATP-binding protein